MHTNGYWPIYNITHSRSSSSNAGPGHTNESTVKFFAIEIAVLNSENMLASLGFFANFFVTNSLRFVIFSSVFFLRLSFLFSTRRVAFPLTYLDDAFWTPSSRETPLPLCRWANTMRTFRHKHQLDAVNCIF